MTDRAYTRANHSGQPLSPEALLWRAVLVRAAADHGLGVSRSGDSQSRYTRPFDFCAWLQTRDAEIVAEQAELCIRLLRKYGPRAVEPGQLLAFSRWLLPRSASNRGDGPTPEKSDCTLDCGAA